MNWQFWTRTGRRPLGHSDANVTRHDTCDTLDLLLSLYADGMASSDEARRVEAHLPTCKSCRESLRWMQATRRALASRPMALPPAGLQAQIARAIATSSAHSAAARPARVFTLRPAYAAAASLTVLGVVVLGHALLSGHSQTISHNTPDQTLPKKIAALPPVAISAPAILLSLPTINHPVAIRVKPQPRPEDRVVVLPEETAVIPHTQVVPALSRRVKHSLPVQPTLLSLSPGRPPTRHKTSDALMAVRTPAPKPLEQSLPLPPLADRTSAPVVASTDVTPTVTIGAPTVTPQESATVKIAAREDLLGSVRQHIGLMRTSAYSSTRKSIKEAAFVAESGLPEKTPGIAITQGGWH